MSLGPMELALILGIALLLFGPSRLPGLGKSLGEAIRGFKKGMDGQDEKESSANRQIGESSHSTNKQKEKNHTEV